MLETIQLAVVVGLVVISWVIGRWYGRIEMRSEIEMEKLDTMANAVASAAHDARAKVDERIIAEHEKRLWEMADKGLAERLARGKGE
jgi:hypothetical protein